MGSEMCIRDRPMSVRYRVTLEAAVCKYREFAVKTKFRNTSFSVRKNPLVKHFRKSQSKFPKNFLFRENRQKVKCCPTPYSRRSKTFELYHFQSPREERRFKETSSSYLWQASKASQLQYYLVRRLQDNEFFTRLKNARRFLSSALS